MNILTHKGRPVTLANLHRLDGRGDPWITHNNWFDPSNEWEGTRYIAASKRKDVIDCYLHFVGGTWRDRHPGIEVQRAPGAPRTRNDR